MAEAGMVRTGVIVGGPAVLRKRFDTVVQIVVPFIGSLFAIRHAVLYGVTWIDAASFVIFLIITGFGITIGLHRLFTHRSFEPHPVVEWIIGAMAAMTLQNNLKEWIADHRRHHAVSDQAGDVHSPHIDTWGGAAEGWAALWHGYVGWRFDNTATDLEVYGKNLDNNPVVRFYTRTHLLWVVLSLALPYGFGYALGGAEAAWSSLLFGGFLRVTVTQHGSFSVNSLGHATGNQDFEMADRSTNQRWLAILTVGEGWHNNHHRFPRSYRAGLYAGQPDLSAWIIERLADVGLAKNLINNSGIDKSMRPGEEPIRGQASS
jgi:stearoyl-CoA desaturase (delta-9 desaturase)